MGGAAQTLSTEQTHSGPEEVGEDARGAHVWGIPWHGLGKAGGALSRSQPGWVVQEGLV